MVEITIQKIKDVDIPKLAKFIVYARKGTVFYKENTTIENIEKELQNLAKDQNELVITASTNGKLIGALRIYVGFPEMAFTEKWHPIIHSEVSDKEIAHEIIQFCKNEVKKRGFSRLEANLSPITSEYTDIYKVYKNWYENEGFYKATEEALMQVDLDKNPLPTVKPILPQEFRFEDITTVDNERIKNAFFDSFRNGRDRLFVDMNTAQQTVSFNFWFNRKRPMHPASILVMKDEKVIGFNLVRKDDNKAEIGPVGVIPKYQRQGIMKAVLYESLKRIQNDGMSIAHLEADVTNEPAMNLYRKYGFQLQYTQQYFAWKL